MQPLTGRRGRTPGLVVLAATLFMGAPVHAHETDQYTLPLDRPFADLGVYLDTVHTLALDRVVSRLNARIDSALSMRPGPTRDTRLAQLHDPTLIADLVYRQFDDPSTEVLELEHVVRTPWAERSFPGQRVARWSLDWLYTYTHLPFDPRRITLIFQASTIKAHGVYFGTDKLSHFHHMGRIYHEAYRAQRRAGKSHEEAVSIVVNEYSDGCLIAENTFLGYIPSGIFSNADLAANYSGFKFYRNLTEPVEMVDGVHEPLVVRKGPHWRLNLNVRPESGWFGAFVSDHWNEALNPCLYSDGFLRSRARAVLRNRAVQIVGFYSAADHRPADAQYYDSLANSLFTLYGEDYGHRGTFEELLTLGNTCIPAMRQREVQRPDPAGVVVPIGWMRQPPKHTAEGDSDPTGAGSWRRRSS